MSDSGKSDKDDLLGKLLGSARGVSQPSSNGISTGATKDKQPGLNPLDLLGLPADQRDLINWLSRHKQAGFDDILNGLGIEPAQLTTLLSALKRDRHIQEALIDGEIYYRVVFGGKVSRAARGLPEGIWELVDLDNTVFLQQISLFRDLSQDELREIAARLEARQYHRSEVILWQGGLGEGIYLIKSGIVGITRLSPDKRDAQILAYLKQGDLLGEYGLLFEQHIAASATATALSEVEMLVLKRPDVLDLLKKHPDAAIELIQMLTQRLLAMETHQRTRQASLCLILAMEPGVGGTTVGTALASRLAQTTDGSVVYTEYPMPGALIPAFGFSSGTVTARAPGGYAVYIPQDLSSVPPTVRTTLIVDHLTDNYAHVVVGVTGDIDESVIYMLERAAQVVIVVTPERAAWDYLSTLRLRLKAAIHPEKTSLLIVCNRSQPALRDLQPPSAAHVDIPWLEGLAPLELRDTLPLALSEAAVTLSSRLGRTNQIGIYVPAKAGMPPMVDKTMAFLSQFFGSAAGYPSSSLSDKEPVGMAGDKLYLVQTYITKADMDRHLGDVLAFVAKLKAELDQDVMALEVNRNVMLV